MCMGEIADDMLNDAMNDPDFDWGDLYRRPISTRCQFCDTMILRRNGQWVETLSNRLHNCRVATADEFPDV